MNSILRIWNWWSGVARRRGVQNPQRRDSRRQKKTGTQSSANKSRNPHSHPKTLRRIAFLFFWRLREWCGDFGLIRKYNSQVNTQYLVVLIKLSEQFLSTFLSTSFTSKTRGDLGPAKLLLIMEIFSAVKPDAGASIRSTGFWGDYVDFCSCLPISNSQQLQHTLAFAVKSAPNFIFH